MAYDQYMYPQEQAGYQAPQVPGIPEAWQWLMNNPYIGPGSIPPSDFSVVNQGVPNALENIGQINQEWSDLGRGMSQRMKTMTPDYPLGQGFMPTPEAAPQFDPSMVANPGLSFPQAAPGPPGGMSPQAATGPSQIGPGGVYEPGMDQAPPPTPVTMQSPESGMQPSAGLGGAGLSPTPSPMQEWMQDYNQQTDDYMAAQREQAKNAMWIQMGQSLLANATDPSMALVGVGQAVSQYGANKPAMEQYKQGRESERLDLLYKMERIRKSQAPREFADRAPKIIKLDDNTIVESLSDGMYRYGDDILTLDEFNEVSRAAAKRARDEKFNEGIREDTESMEAQIESLMGPPLNMGREEAEAAASSGVKFGRSTPKQREVVDPKSVLDAQRAQIMSDPELARIVQGMSDEQFAEFMREVEAYGSE